jgi:hypothetical protein
MLGSGIDVPANGMRRDANVVIQIDDEFVGKLLEGTIEGPRLARRRLEKILGMQPRVGRGHDSFSTKLLAIFHNQHPSVFGREFALRQQRKRSLQQVTPVVADDDDDSLQGVGHGLTVTQ